MASESLNLLNKRLTYFLSNRLKWEQLNLIQDKAIPEIINRNDTLVIAPTASGKTEAVLVPVFSHLLDNHPDPTSVLYISPLKALINDMEDRIGFWSKHFDFTVTKWHGDVSKTEKDKFIKNPTDFLLITPESLEVIFMNKSERDKEKIFKNIQYVIIDEIHYFAESDRGIQLNSLLNRIDNYTNIKSTRVGLSATVGNPEEVSKWLNYKNPAKIVKIEDNRQFKYKVWGGDKNQFLNRLKEYQGQKVLIFAPSRASVEEYYKMMEYTGFDNIFLHHSSMGKFYRESNEKKFKEAKYGFMISTSTLELGIDIGNIDIVVQINPPTNISSFLQRIGRGGRRSKLQKSIIYCNYFWSLVTLSEIELIHNNLIEDLNIPTNSKDIFFHQILSVIFEYGKISYKEIYDKLSSCYVFSDITKKDYIKILKSMLEQEFISKNNDYLTLGYNFEEKFGKVNFKDFYSVLCPTFEYLVRYGSKDVGSVDASYALMIKPYSSFVLGGNYWRVINIDYKKFIIYVDPHIVKSDIPNWLSNIIPISFLISRKMYDIILGNFDKNIVKEYFDDSLEELINKTISCAKNKGFSEGVIPVEINQDSKQITIYTFAGNVVNNFLTILFEFYYEVSAIKNNNFYVKFKVKEDISFSDVEAILYNFKNILDDEDFKIVMKDKSNKFYKNKFINYLPIDDEINLKMNVLFDRDNIAKFIDDNTLVEVKDVNFKNWFSCE